MISISSSGSFKNLESFLKRASTANILDILRHYGREGVRALEQATPIDSGLASRSWSFEVSARKGVYRIVWNNSDIESGFPVAIMLQYGYGTGTGGFVQGQDYINPAMKPIFDKIADKVWKAVTSG